MIGPLTSAQPLWLQHFFCSCNELNQGKEVFKGLYRMCANNKRGQALTSKAWTYKSTSIKEKKNKESNTTPFTSKSIKLNNLQKDKNVCPHPTWKKRGEEIKFFDCKIAYQKKNSLIVILFEENHQHRLNWVIQFMKEGSKEAVVKSE